MAASVNKVIVLGNLGQDPELRYTANQIPVATLNIATTDYRTTADGQKQEITEWHRVVVWSKLAENCAKYLAKGRPVFVEGKLQTRSWEDKATGQKRYATEIVAQNVQFLGGGARDGAANFSPRTEQSNPYAQSSGGGLPDFDLGTPSVGSAGGNDSSAMDDIPF